MFENKKDAEAHDKMLELAMSITGLLRQNISGIDEKVSEEVGLLLAQRRDDLAKACKGNPDILFASSDVDTDVNGDEEDQKVALLVASQ